MARRLVSGIFVVLAVALGAPAGAQARTACAAEQSAPTAANSAQVSDAIFCLTNQIRVSYGLAPFRRDVRLDAAARLHSEDMATRKYFAHDTPEGLSASDRAAAQGYPSDVGENIAAGYPTARAVMIGWMASQGHCENILGKGRAVGVGTAATPRPTYTQDFGDYDFGSGGAAAAGCPYAVDLASLVTPDPAGPVAAGPATSPSVRGPTPSPATASPAARLALGGLGLSSARLHGGGRGSVVSYTLSGPATVTFRVERELGGGRWRALRGSLTDAGRRGDNSFRFRGRLRGQALAAGRYRLTAVATDAAGNASPLRRVRLRIVRA